MKTFQLHTFITAFSLFGISGCDGPSGEAEPPKKTASSDKTQVTQNALPMPPPTTNTMCNASIDQLARKVQGVRTGTHGSDAIVAMHQLLEQWSPTGKRVAEVKAMLGAPSEEDGVKLVYSFDGGDQEYEWTLAIEGGTIKSVEKVLHE